MYFSPHNYRWNFTDDTWSCRREDEMNLINEYLNRPTNTNLTFFENAKLKYVEDRGQLNAVNAAETDYLLGNFKHLNPVLLF
jgi:hypothetical protein